MARQRRRVGDKAQLGCSDADGVVTGGVDGGIDRTERRGAGSCIGDSGSGGPALIDVGSRFTIPYLVEAVITPNKTVSPIFKWTMFTRKDGTKTAGLIIGENGAEIELLLPAATRQTIVKDSIAKREMQDRSPMPEGLIATSDDLRDLLAYLVGLKESE